MYPNVARLISGHTGLSHVKGMLSFAGTSGAIPLLDILDDNLRILGNAHVNLKATNTVDLLRGDEQAFLAGFAETVGLRWLLERGLLHEVSVHLQVGEAVSRGQPCVEGAIAWRGRGAVLFDIKSTIAHIQRYVDDVAVHVNAELASNGHSDLRFAAHRTGTGDVEHVGKNLERIKAMAVAAIPQMLGGASVDIWKHPDFRLRATLRKTCMQSAFFSEADVVGRRQDLLWNQLRQLSMSRPFLLVSVRTMGMGIEVGGIGDVFRSALLGKKGLSSPRPIFGSRSREKASSKTTRPKCFVQRCLSGVLFIDLKDDRRLLAEFYTNRYARHPVPLRIRRRLRARVGASIW